MFLRLKMFFSIHKQKVFIILLTIVTLILFIIAAIILHLWKKGSYKRTTFISAKKDFSITLPDTLEMDICTDNNYELILKSKSGNNIIAVSKAEQNPVYSIEDIIASDKNNFVTQFEQTSNISEIVPITLKDKNYYRYSFDSKDSYVEVYWLPMNDSYYVFDFVYDKSSQTDLKSNINSILETLEFTNNN